MLHSSKSGRAAYQSPRPRPIQGEQGGQVPIKAQPQESPTLPSRAPTTLLQAEAEGRHARPRFCLGEEETRPGRPGGLTAPNLPGRCLLIPSIMSSANTGLGCHSHCAMIRLYQLYKDAETDDMHRLLGRQSAEFLGGSVNGIIEYSPLYFARVRPGSHHCNPANWRLCPSQPSTVAIYF